MCIRFNVVQCAHIARVCNYYITLCIKFVIFILYRINKMSSLHGLPPLPKSLSGFNLLDSQENPPTPIRTSSIRSGQASGHLVYPPHPKTVNGTAGVDMNQQMNQVTGGRKSTNLDTQLAILRREMVSCFNYFIYLKHLTNR